MVCTASFLTCLVRTAVLLYHKYGIERSTKTLLQSYDFIVVGGGSAGAIVASKLSENPKVNVLLIEAGGSGNHITDIPFISTSIVNMSRSYPTTVQTSGFGNGKPYKFAAARILGGGSTRNGMVWVRANRQDLTEWTNYGIEGWSYDDVLPYSKQLETFEDRNVGTKDRGLHGPVHVSRQEPYPFNDIRERWRSAAVQIGYKLGDYNGPRPAFFADVQKNIGHCVRQSSDNVYLRPFEGKRSNLHLIMFSQVTRVLFDDCTAIGVEYSRYGALHRVYATKEVILSAGALVSPQLLLLSGVGDPMQLAQYGIKPVATVLGVGRNMQDMVTVRVKMSTNATFPTNSKVNQENYDLWKRSKKGILAASGHCSAGYIKSCYSKNSYDTQIYFGLNCNQDSGFYLFSTEVATARVYSRGFVTLQSSDPFDLPLINPMYLSDRKDVVNIRYGMKRFLKLMNTTAFNDIKPRLIISSESRTCSDQFKQYSNAWYDCFVRVNGRGTNHQCCTCKMGNSLDPMAVVDNRLRVRFVQRLRVIDASVMPQVTRGNTNAPTMMIGLKGADMVKQDWNL